jgi:hypothetical protein
MSLSEHNPGAADEKCGGEEHSAGVREPKPLTETAPIASDSSHARMLGQRNERHLAPGWRTTPRAGRLLILLVHADTRLERAERHLLGGGSLRA